MLAILGWKASKGVTAEIALALDYGNSVTYWNWVGSDLVQIEKPE